MPYDLLGIYGRKKLAQQDNNKKQNRVSFMAHEAKVAFTQAF